MPKVRFLLVTLTYANHDTHAVHVSNDRSLILMTSFNQLLQKLMVTLMFSDHTCTRSDMTIGFIQTFASAVTKNCAGLKAKERACTHIQFVHIYLALTKTHNLAYNIAVKLLLAGWLWWSVKHCPAFLA